jgi:phosphate-selective porin OprO/OprP
MVVIAIEVRGEEYAPEIYLDDATAAWHDCPTPRASCRFTGRADVDVIGTTQSAANEAVFGDLGNVAGVRRAWIGAEGDFASGGRYEAVIDLASGNVVIRDLFVGIGEREEVGEFRAGHYLEPFSLELGTASFTLPFLECSAVSILDPARNWGLGVFRSRPSDSSTLALGIFQAGSDPNDFEADDGSTVGLTGRLTAAPIFEGDGEQLLHFGLAFSERIPEHGVIVISQQAQSPLINLGDSATSPFLPQIRVPAGFQQLLNLQLAAVNGPLWTQAEWSGSWIDQTSGRPVLLHGCHADCGWFITGEHREYLQSSGTFGPVQVNRPVIGGCHASRDRPAGWGAWELTARFAYLDFEDPDTPRGPAGQSVGLRLPQSTLGVNWYLADHVRLMFNYSYALPDEPNTGTSVANIFAARLGVHW